MSSTNNGNNKTELTINFLTEDLKDTAEHLRETDRKLYVSIQLYSGAFVFVSSLILDDFINIENFHSPFGLGLLIILFFFTFWTFWYSLKINLTKKIFLNRMNFLRREIHKTLRTRNSELLGYWTGKINSQKKEDTESAGGKINKTEPQSPIHVGLDDLYPIALQGALVFVMLGIAIIFYEINYEKLRSNFYFLCYSLSLSLIIFFTILVIMKVMKNNIQHEIIDNQDKYAKSSDI